MVYIDDMLYRFQCTVCPPELYGINSAYARFEFMAQEEVAKRLEVSILEQFGVFTYTPPMRFEHPDGTVGRMFTGNTHYYSGV